MKRIEQRLIINNRGSVEFKKLMQKEIGIEGSDQSERNFKICQ